MLISLITQGQREKKGINEADDTFKSLRTALHMPGNLLIVLK